MTSLTAEEKAFVKGACKAALAVTHLERQALWRDGDADVQKLMEIDDRIAVYEGAWDKLKRELGL